MSQINRPPKGLQKLLGSQSFGENPNNLLRDVRPIVDMFGMLGTTLLRTEDSVGSRNDEGLICSLTLDGSVALVAVSAVTNGAIPQAETIGHSIRLRNIAGDSATDGVPIYAEYKSYASGALPVIAYTLSRPLVLESGIAVDLYYDYLVGAGMPSVDLRVIYYDLEPGGSL